MKHEDLETYVTYLLRSTLADSMPVAVAVNVGDSSPLVNWVEGEEVNLFNPGSCL